jgi:hypothetical protein
LAEVVGLQQRFRDWLVARVVALAGERLLAVSEQLDRVLTADFLVGTMPEVVVEVLALQAQMRPQTPVALVVLVLLLRLRVPQYPAQAVAVVAVILWAVLEPLVVEMVAPKCLKLRQHQVRRTLVAVAVVEPGTHLPVPALLALSSSHIRHSYLSPLGQD